MKSLSLYSGEIKFKSFQIKQRIKILSVNFEVKKWLYFLTSAGLRVSDSNAAADQP